jgi:hypothetical protein
VAKYRYLRHAYEGYYAQEERVDQDHSLARVELEEEEDHVGALKDKEEAGNGEEGGDGLVALEAWVEVFQENVVPVDED